MDKKEYQRQYYLKRKAKMTPEEVEAYKAEKRAYMKEYYKNNKHVFKAYYEKNKNKNVEVKKAKKKAYMKEYYKKNRLKLLERTKTWYKENPKRGAFLKMRGEARKQREYLKYKEFYEKHHDKVNEV